MLLMVSTFGMQRLETGLHAGPCAARSDAQAVIDDLVERAEQEAQANRSTTRQPQLSEGIPLPTVEPCLPTRERVREYACASPNPQFQRTRYPNPV